MASLKQQAATRFPNNPYITPLDLMSPVNIDSKSIKMTRTKGITSITASILSDPKTRVVIYKQKVWASLFEESKNNTAEIPVLNTLNDTSITETLPEEVELLSNEKYYKGIFQTAYRFPFADSGKRYYFDKQGNIFSGLTGAISYHPLFDKSYLAKIAHQKAMEEGTNVYKEWEQAADYGTLLHTFVSLHEIAEKDFKFDFNNLSGWMEYLRDYCIRLGYSHLIPKWSNWIQNDMAAWFTFKKDRNVKVLLSEVCVKSVELGIMTPIDIVCELDWEKKRQVATINIKSGKSIAYEDIKFQSFVESTLFNGMVEETSKKATVSLLWKPKDRQKKPCEYEISTNLVDGHSIDDMKMLGYIVKVRGLNKPKGVIMNISGTESDFVINKLTPEQYVSLFLTSKS